VSILLPLVDSISHKKPRTGLGFKKQKHDELTGSYRPLAVVKPCIVNVGY